MPSCCTLSACTLLPAPIIALARAINSPSHPLFFSFSHPQVEDLKKQNVELRHKVITTAAAPPDKHAGELDGELMRRSRTGPI